MAKMSFICLFLKGCWLLHLAARVGQVSRGRDLGCPYALDRYHGGSMEEHRHVQKVEKVNRVHFSPRENDHAFLLFHTSTLFDEQSLALEASCPLSSDVQRRDGRERRM